MSNEERVKAGPQRSAAERRRMFLEAFERSGEVTASLEEAGVESVSTFRRWRRENQRFKEAFNRLELAHAEAEEEPPVTEATRPPTLAERKRIFLATFARIGTLTAGCDEAGIELRTLHHWLQENKRFRDAFNEAKLRFLDRIEKKIMDRINYGRDKHGVMLRFKAQAELPEKYGRPGKQTPSKGRAGLTMEDLERMMEEADEAEEEGTC